MFSRRELRHSVKIFNEVLRELQVNSSYLPGNASPLLLQGKEDHCRVLDFRRALLLAVVPAHNDQDCISFRVT